MVPHQRCRFSTEMNAADFAARLALLTTEKLPWVRSLVGKYEFVGTVSSERFQLTPVVSGRNTYLPRVTGTLRPESGRTEIELTQTLHPVAIVAVILILGSPVIASIVARDFASAAGLIVMVLVFHTVMYFVGFRPEARRIEARFRQLANGGA